MRLWVGDNYTYPLLVQACTIRLSEFEGKQIHDHVLRVGFDLDAYVQNTLINMYVVCGKMGDAHRLFDESLHFGFSFMEFDLGKLCSDKGCRECQWVFGVVSTTPNGS
jgi:pentatricopeptide repeat protein